MGAIRIKIGLVDGMKKMGANSEKIHGSGKYRKLAGGEVVTEKA